MFNNNRVYIEEVDQLIDHACHTDHNKMFPVEMFLLLNVSPTFASRTCAPGSHVATLLLKLVAKHN